MTSLPPISQLTGNHGTLFESYWSQLDTNRNGRVDATSAAAFLKKSQLREPILHKIWELSDPNGKGYLDKQGFFLALRLVAACQNGKEPSVGNLALVDPPPRLVGVDSSTLASLTRNKWTIEHDERSRFDGVFQSLQPVGGLLTGDKVKPVMLASKLPLDTLGKIWNLSDIDRDGKLDVEEFAVAMRLITLCQAGEILPATLPSSLVPASKPSKTSGVLPSATALQPSPAALQSLPAALQPSPAALQPSPAASLARSHSPKTTSPLPTQKASPEWVITSDIKAKYDSYFEGIDKDHDGIVSGEEARGLLMASNLQQPVLAHIWSLCDIQKNGKLNAEQFALAMHLVAEKVRGKEPPKELTPAMIPPSLRKQQQQPPAQPAQPSQPSTTLWAPTPFTSTPPLLPTPASTTQLAMSSAAITSTTTTTTASGGSGGGSFANDFSAIMELDGIANEIESIRKEKNQLQDDIKQKQELIQQRKGEIESLQGEVEVVTKQREELEREKLGVQGQLDQLNSQKAKFDGEITELKKKCAEEEEEIRHLKQQLTQQESSKRAQSEEMAQLQEQLESLRREEKEYKQKVESSAAELEKLQKASQTIHNDITMTRHKLDSLKEEHQTLSTALTMYPPVSTPGSTPSSSVVNISDVGQLSGDLHAPHLAEPDAISARATAGSSSPVSSISGFSTNSHLEEGGEEGNKEDKQRSDPFGSTSTTTDPFAAFSVPIGGDPFASSTAAVFSGKPSDPSAFDPFGPSDPFKSASSSSQTGIGDDLFKNDPFGTPATLPSASPAHLHTSTPPSSTATTDPFSGQDPFTSDPFSTTKGVNQDSGWSGAGPFSVDPFSQQTANTPTDPFTSGDPFNDDPFGSKPLESRSNPFATPSSSAFPSGGSKPLPQWSVQDPLPRPRAGAVDKEHVAWMKRDSEREEVMRRQRQQKEDDDLAKALRESLQNS